MGLGPQVKGMKDAEPGKAQASCSSRADSVPWNVGNKTPHFSGLWAPGKMWGGAWGPE